MKKITIIFLIIGILCLNLNVQASGPIIMSMSITVKQNGNTICSYVDDKTPDEIDGIWKDIRIVARNQRTNKFIYNRSFGNPTVGMIEYCDFQLQLADFDDLVIGDIVEITAEYVKNNNTYVKMITYEIPIGYKAIVYRTIELPPSQEGDNDDNGNGNYPPPSDGRTHNNFTVYGYVKDSSANYTNGSKVFIKNLNTGNKTELNVTKGNYSYNLGELYFGWKIGDRISVNATYKSGFQKEYGKAPSFYIYGGMNKKERNIDMYVIGEEGYIPIDENDVPETYDGLLDLYQSTLEELEDAEGMVLEYEKIIVELTESIEQQNTTYTEEEVNLLIEDAVAEAKNNLTCDNTLTILLFIIVILIILYMLYDKGIIPIGKNKYNYEEPIRKNTNVKPVRKRYR